MGLTQLMQIVRLRLLLRNLGLIHDFTCFSELEAKKKPTDIRWLSLFRDVTISGLLSFSQFVLLLVSGLQNKRLQQIRTYRE